MGLFTSSGRVKQIVHPANWEYVMTGKSVCSVKLPHAIFWTTPLPWGQPDTHISTPPGLRPEKAGIDVSGDCREPEAAENLWPVALRPGQAVFRGKRGKLSERRQSNSFDA